MLPLSVSWVLAALVGGIGGVAMWRLLHPPMPLHLAPIPSWAQRWAPEAGKRMMRRWNSVTQRAVQVFAVTPTQVVTQSALFGGVTLIMVWLLFHASLLIALPVAALVAWQLPPYLLRSRYIRWRQAVVADFATITLLLRIYWDLGFSVPASLEAIRPALGAAMQSECDRLLGAINRGERGEAWQAFADRVHHSSFHLLAQVVRQNWDTNLSGEALNPLDTLVETTRAQQLIALANQLDAVNTLVPILAILGTIIVFIYGMFLNLHL